jgi:hypothetical protein
VVFRIDAENFSRSWMEVFEGKGLSGPRGCAESLMSVVVGVMVRSGWVIFKGFIACEEREFIIGMVLSGGIYIMWWDFGEIVGVDKVKKVCRCLVF